VRNQVIEYLLGPGKRRPQPGPSSPNTTTSPIAKSAPAATPATSVAGSSDVTAPQAATGAVSAPREVAA